MKVLEMEMEPLSKLSEPSPEFAAFAAQVQAEAGKDIEKMKELEATKPELVAERHKQMDLLGEMLKEVKNIQLRKIPKKNVPEQITARQLRAIESILY